MSVTMTTSAVNRPILSPAHAVWIDQPRAGLILHAPILVAVGRAMEPVGIPHAAALPLSVCATALAAFGLTAHLRRSATLRHVV